MLLDPLTVEAGEDGRWRHAPFPGDADAPAQNIDLPDRMGVRIDAHEASGRQRSSEAQCIFGSAFTNAPHPAAKRAVKSSGLGGAVADARTHWLTLLARGFRHRWLPPSGCVSGDISPWDHTANRGGSGISDRCPAVRPVSSIAREQQSSALASAPLKTGKVA